MNISDILANIYRAGFVQPKHPGMVPGFMLGTPPPAPPAMPPMPPPTMGTMEGLMPPPMPGVGAAPSASAPQAGFLDMLGGLLKGVDRATSPQGVQGMLGNVPAMALPSPSGAAMDAFGLGSRTAPAPEPAAAAAPTTFSWPTSAMPSQGTASITIGGDVDLGKAAQAIKNIESSGGNYQAIGPTHPELGRALGAYQVMEKNVGPWTKEILGKEMSPEEFLASPAAQDAVFRGKFGQYAQKTGSVADAASMWFTGRPAAEGAKKEDSLGTTGAGYVQKFLSGYGAPQGLPQPGALPGMTLPVAPAVQPMSGLNPQAYDRFDSMSVVMPPPLSTGDRLTNVLGQMAAGARGGKNVADVLLGAGAGAGRGATENISEERRRIEQGAEKTLKLDLIKAEAGVGKARAQQEGANYRTQAQNQTAANTFNVQTAQAKIDHELQTRNMQRTEDFDWKKIQIGTPDIKPTKDGGYMVVQRDPSDLGKIKLTMKSGNDLDKAADDLKDVEDLVGGDKTNPRYRAALYQNILKSNVGAGQEAVDLAVKREVLRGLVFNHPGAVKDLLGEQYKALDKTVTEGIPATDLANPNKGPAIRNQRMFDKLIELWGQKKGDFEKVFIPKAAQLGDPGARVLMTGGALGR